MNTQGQLTVTIIISILVLSMFALAFYLTGNAVEQKIDTSSQKQKAGQEALKPLKDYVQQCLDQLGSQGLELLGSQGGHIYATPEQNGPSPEPISLGVEFVLDGKTKVSRGIAAPVGSLGTIFHHGFPDEYPWRTFPYTAGSTLFTGYYGLNKLSPITGNGSVAQELEQYIENTLPQCSDWTIFEGRDFVVQSGTPDVTVTLADSDVRIAVRYSVNITNAATGLSAQLDKFESTFPVRLNKILNFSHAIIDRDVSDLNFIIDGTQSGLPGDLNPIVAQVVRKADGGSIVKIKDPKSKLINGQYLFQFARENREPALFYLGTTNVNPQVDAAFAPSKEYCTGPTAQITYNSQTHAVDVEQNSCGGQDTSIPVEFRDPDDENLSVTVTRSIDPVQTPFTIDSAVYGSSFIVNVSDGKLSDVQLVSLYVPEVS